MNKLENLAIGLNDVRITLARTAGALRTATDKHDLAPGDAAIDYLKGVIDEAAATLNILAPFLERRIADVYAALSEIDKKEAEREKTKARIIAVIGG
jgi:hypothetical protein